MNDGLIRNILYLIVLVVLVVFAVRILTWALSIVLPIAVVVIAGYIVYRVISGRKGF